MSPFYLNQCHSPTVHYTEFPLVPCRATGHLFHAVHLEPGGGDAAAEAAEAGAEAAAVPEQGRRARYHLFIFYLVYVYMIVYSLFLCRHGWHAQDLRRGALQGRALQDSPAVDTGLCGVRRRGDVGEVRQASERGGALLPRSGNYCCISPFNIYTILNIFSKTITTLTQFLEPPCTKLAYNL